ncbi:hypothetical protein [Azospirillum sp. B21]|uniref:hypothetical protein n=1 Tax=Azospirillum sp. B21 TaxID=2607496 RepID=UPI001B3BF22F|nr:hypothetical protein [Azospirillum sp. B21]
MSAQSSLDEIWHKVAKATIAKPSPQNGIAIATHVGEHLADRLADELADMLAQVMPSAIVKTIGNDVLPGAEKIAEFVYGTAEDRRKVYHLAQTSKIPVFRMGALVCARKSTLLRWIADQEAKVGGVP